MLVSASEWTLNVFGVPSLSKEQQKFKLKRKKSLALLLYLALTRRASHREMLSGFLWPELDDASARTNLRSVVSDINSLLGRQWCIASAESLQLAPDFALTYNYAELEAASNAKTLPVLSDEKLDHWQVPLMEGFYLKDCEAFDEWLYMQRESAYRCYHQLLEKLLSQAIEKKDSQRTYEIADRLRVWDPLYEPAYAALMQEHATSGHTEQALKLYATLSEVLQRELGIQPGADVAQLKEDIQTGKLSSLPIASTQHPPITAPVTEVAYARREGMHIAYKTIDSGKPPLVVVWGFVSHLDQLTDLPSLSHFFQELSNLYTVVLFDKRGMGLSDRVAEPASLETMADDVISILDDLAIEKAGLLGFSEGGPTAICCAHRHPGRIDHLVLYGTAAKWVQSEDYPHAIPNEAYDRWISFLENNWGKANNLAHFAPSEKDSDVMTRWWSKCIRMSASPGSVRSVLEQDRHIDVRALLPEIVQPTLVIQKTKDRMMRLENGRYLAEHIPSATYVELPGADHWMWAGNTAPIFTALKDFFRALP